MADMTVTAGTTGLEGYNVGQTLRRCIQQGWLYKRSEGGLFSQYVSSSCRALPWGCGARNFDVDGVTVPVHVQVDQEVLPRDRAHGDRERDARGRRDFRPAAGTAGTPDREYVAALCHQSSV